VYPFCVDEEDLKMEISQTFLKRMKEEFGDSLRIRWSNAGEEYVVEQKIGPARTLPPGFETDDDIRARDGYAFVLAVQPREKMPCKTCRTPLDIPNQTFAEIRCDYCRYRGKDGRWGAGYFPLNEVLIDKLKQVDPTRRWSADIKAKLDARNKAVVDERERKAQDALDYAMRENHHRVVGNPRSTYKVNWNDVQ
jgi:hypothetical protein